MLTSDQLTAMRTQQAAALPDAAEIWRVQQVDDGNGGFTETWVKNETTTGRIGTVGYSESEREIAARLANVTPYMVTLPYNTNVNGRDRIKVGSRIFEIVAVLAPTLETARRCVCREIV